MKIRILPSSNDPASNGLKTYDYETDYIPQKAELIVFDGWHRVVEALSPTFRDGKLVDVLVVLKKFK